MSSWKNDRQYDPQGLGLDVATGAEMGLRTAIEAMIEQYEHERDRIADRDRNVDGDEAFVDKRDHQVATLRSMLDAVENEGRLDTDRRIYGETLTTLLSEVETQVENHARMANTHAHEQGQRARSQDLDAFLDELRDHVAEFRDSA